MEPNYYNQTTAQQPASTSTVFTPQKPAGKSLPVKTIIMVGILVLVLVGLVLGFDKARSFLSKAAGGGGCEPVGIRENSLTSTSVEVVFTTEKACQAEVVYGISQDGMLLSVPEAMASLNHRIRLSPLLPSTSYYYQVKADGEKYDPVRSFLTLSAQIPPTQAPTQAPVAPPQGKYTFEDFTPYFGTPNPAYDIDKNGVVNSADWLLYQQK